MKADNRQILDELTNTLLYEGYALYPYRRSALKNQKPVPFGVLFPNSYCRCNVHTNNEMQTQCILLAGENGAVDITVKFLQLIKVELFVPDVADREKFVPANKLQAGNELYTPGWKAEAHEISKSNPDIISSTSRQVYPFEAKGKTEAIKIHNECGHVIGKLVFTALPLSGLIELETRQINESPNAHIVTIKISNTTGLPDPEKKTRDEAMQSALVSVHTVLSTDDGRFVSCQNPDDEWKEQAKSLKNLNTWPILIDDQSTTLLSSPVILYDQPQVNIGSKGNLFDNTEIEEALWLHVNVLTDDEKRQMKHDPRTSEALNIAESLSHAELIKLHNQLQYKA